MSLVSGFIKFAVHPWSIRIFMGLWALFLADQIRLNYQFYGTSWVCWDYMLISGTLAFFLAIWLATRINKRLERTIEQLRLNNVLILDEAGVSALRQDMTLRGRRVQLWSGVLITLVIVASYLAVFGGALRQLLDTWLQGTNEGAGMALLYLVVFTVLSALAAMLAGLFFGRMAHYGTFATVLANKSIQLRVVPGHFDGAAGLKPIGDFYLYQALVMAVPIIWLGLWWAWVIPSFGGTVCPITNRPQWLFVDWQWPFFAQWLVVLAYFHFVFIRPFMQLRRRIGDKRGKLRARDVAQLQERLRMLHGDWPNEISGRATARETEADTIAQQLWHIQNMSDWPMDPRTLGRFRSLLLGEVIVPIAIQLAAIAQGGPSILGKSANDWLGKMISSIF